MIHSNITYATVVLVSFQVPGMLQAWLWWLQRDSNAQSLSSQINTGVLTNLIGAAWVTGWVFGCEQGSCRFEPSCSHLNFRYRACYQQRGPWRSGNFRMRIHAMQSCDMTKIQVNYGICKIFSWLVTLEVISVNMKDEVRCSISEWGLHTIFHASSVSHKFCALCYSVPLTFPIR